MSAPNETKVRNIFQKVVEDFKTQLEDLNKKMNSFNPKLQTLGLQIQNKIKQSCPKQFDWLEANSVMQSDGSMDLRTDIPQDERDRKLKELEKCADDNDQGLRLFFDEVGRQQMKAQDNANNCFETCYEKSSSLADDELKVCFKNCFNSNITEMNNIFNAIERKINDVQKIL